MNKAFKGKDRGLLSASMSLTCSSDLTISFPGIGTHTNTISNPWGEYSAHLGSYSQSQIFLWLSFFHQVPVYTARYAVAHMEWETCPKFLHMTKPGIEPQSLDQVSRTSFNHTPLLIFIFLLNKHLFKTKNNSKNKEACVFSVFCVK